MQTADDGARRDENLLTLRRLTDDTRSLAVLRGVLFLSGSLLVWAFSGIVGYVVWAATYTVLERVYVRLLFWGEATGVSRSWYAFLLTLRTTLYFMFAGLAIAVAFQGSLMELYLGCIAAVALGIQTVISGTRPLHMIVLDIAAVVFASFGSVLAVLAKLDTVAQSVVIIITITCVTGYFIYGLSRVAETQRNLADRRIAELQAEKMAAIGQLSAGVAHDFNNILTVIQGNLDLIAAVDDPQQRAEFVEEARQGTVRAAHLVHQLLAYSHKSRLEAEVVDLPAALRETAEVLRRLMPEPVQVTLAEPLPVVSLRVDPQLLQTALLNAALNARDAMLPVGGEIELALELHGDMAVLSVYDTGPGLPETLLGKATEPFFSTKPRGAGTGLGLSMIKGFAEQSGGHLHLANRPGGGLEVSISLPRHVARQFKVA